MTDEDERTWTFPAGDAGELVDTDDRAHIRRLVYGSRVVIYPPDEPEPAQGAAGGKSGRPRFATWWEWLLIGLAWAFAIALVGVMFFAAGYGW